MIRKSSVRWLMTGLSMAILAGAIGCSNQMVPNALDPENAPKKGEGWICLFNGEDLTGWHKRPGDDRDLLWVVEDGAMVNKLEPGQHGSNIVSDDRFRDFELYYEYLVPKDSNSGMYLRGLYEVQMRGDAGESGGRGTDGGIWATSAPKVNASKPAGEWQSVYLKLVGQTVEKVILNGTVIHEDVELTKPTGTDLRDIVKMEDPGPIMIQGDHGFVRVRNITIKPLGGCPGSGCPKKCCPARTPEEGA